MLCFGFQGVVIHHVGLEQDLHILVQRRQQLSGSRIGTERRSRTMTRGILNKPYIGRRYVLGIEQRVHLGRAHVHVG